MLFMWTMTEVIWAGMTDIPVRPHESEGNLFGLCFCVTDGNVRPPSPCVRTSGNKTDYKDMR